VAGLVIAPAGMLPVMTLTGHVQNPHWLVLSLHVAGVNFIPSTEMPPFAAQPVFSKGFILSP
jgi:hypothetical protein